MVKFDEYIVAYIDILGTSEKIRNDVDNSHFKLFKNIYEETAKYIKLNNIYTYENTLYPKLNFKIFSDNIIVFAKCSSYMPQEIGTLAGWVVGFQAMALMKGLLTRGAISCGEFYHDENFVYGKALLEAVKLEEKNSIYPRVIYDPQIKYNQVNSLQDIDGLKFIDYIPLLWRFLDHRKCSKKNLLTVKQHLLSLCKKNVNGNIKILQKYQWLISQYNCYCKDLSTGKIHEPLLEDNMSFEGVYINPEDSGLPSNDGSQFFRYPIERIN